jgi:uncharacterized protein (TIGR04255 family)
MGRHLAHAPITEAVIDFKVKPKDGVAYEQVYEAFKQTDFGYYLKTPISEGTFAIGMGPDGQLVPPSTTSALVGLRFHSSDERYVLQARRDSFTLSRLAPYETWESLLEEAKRLWAIYVARLEPVGIFRIATRFINNLRLPLRAGEEFQVYINALTQIPLGAPQSVEGFFQRFQLADPSIDAHVILSLALNGLEPDGRVPVILDIDAFKLTGEKAIDAMMWTELESLRKLKNDCFFGALTERAQELYR